MFHLTNDSTEIQLQMHILDIITKLSGNHFEEDLVE
jgi:hypothetical protein